MDPELPLPEVSSQIPEQIPMPDDLPVDERGAPPSSHTKELSPAEKNNILIQFMGAQYGELNKLDSHIVGHGLGKGSSQKVKQQVAQVLESTQTASAPVHAPPPTITPPPAAHPVPTPPVPTQPTPADIDQLEFNFDVNEKQELLSMVRTLVDSVKAQRKEIDLLTSKIDSLIKVSKKKSNGLSRKTVDTATEV